jgi:NAD(P)-dependent dehydrogenase (short-subunit alcohol dehydrogenase family)
LTESRQKCVVITGAAGDIGCAAARQFAAPGTALALLDRGADLVEGIADECRSAGANVLTLGADQTRREPVEEVVAKVVAEFGAIDVLFANAGYGKFGTFLEQSDKMWRRHVDVNLNGTFAVCQVVARQMVRQGSGGAIVVNASSGATQYTNLLSAYCVTKAGLAMLVQAMAAELGPYNIRVNGVLPGVIETGMTAPMLGNGDGQRGYLLRETPMGRLGRPEDIAAAVAYLASPAASFVTGHSIAVDGGQTLVGQPQWYVTDYTRKSDAEWTAAS